METFLLFIGAFLLMAGVKLIYDARIIVEKYFSVINKNSATLVLKVFGTLFAFIGAILVSKYLVF